MCCCTWKFYKIIINKIIILAFEIYCVLFRQNVLMQNILHIQEKCQWIAKNNDFQHLLRTKKEIFEKKNYFTWAGFLILIQITFTTSCLGNQSSFPIFKGKELWILKFFFFWEFLLPTSVSICQHYQFDWVDVFI